MLDFIKELRQLSKAKNINRQEAADQMAAIKLPFWLELISSQLPWMIVVIMWLGAMAVTILFYRMVSFNELNLSNGMQIILISLSLFIFALSFVLIGGLLSNLGRPGIIAGKFPRVASHPIYALRRIYGTAWSQVYYFKPLYAAFLAVPWLKKLLFSIYGYRGSISFVTYPDSWIRDLPLLKIGRGVYLANRCTVGTNLCLNDGSILVGECYFEDESMVGHLAIFGLGCHLGKKSEIGVGTSLGIRVKIGESSQISPKSVIYHGVEIGNKAKVGACSVIGMKAKIGDGVELPIASVIASGVSLLTQSDADHYFSSETQKLKEQKDELANVLRMNVHEFSPEGRKN